MPAALGEVFIGGSGGREPITRKSEREQPMAEEGYIVKPHTALTPHLALPLPFPGRVNDSLGLPGSMCMCCY